MHACTHTHTHNLTHKPVHTPAHTHQLTEGPLSVEETRIWHDLCKRRPPPPEGRPPPHLIQALAAFKADLKCFLSTLDGAQEAFVKKRDKQITKEQKAAAKKNTAKNCTTTPTSRLQHTLLPFHRGSSRLGIDIGRVISTVDTDKPSRGPRDLSPVRMFGVSTECIAAVRALTQHFGAENTFLLSKCGTKMQEATVAMLGANNFFQRTGVRPTHALFCFQRGGVLAAGTPLQMRPLARPDDVDPTSPHAVGFGKAQVTA